MSKIDVLMKDITKKYGVNTAGYGLAQEEYDKIPFSSPRLNYMTFGGLATGRIYEFYGPEGSGKTTTAMDIIKNAQIKFAKEYEERCSEDGVTLEPDNTYKDRDGNTIVEKQVFFLDEEGTFDRVWASKFGVDVEKIAFFRPQGESAEEVLDVMRQFIETGEIGLAVLDSVATLVSGQVYDESFDKKAYGGIAQTLTRFVNVIKGPLLRYNCTLIMINQVRQDLNSMFGGQITPGGQAFKHACSARFCFRKGKFIDKDGNELNNAAENPAGNIVHMVIAKSKIFEATRRVGYYTINYVHGPDVVNDYVEVGKQIGVINQRGAFFDIIDTLTGEVLNTNKIQGKVKLKSELQSHPEWLQLINDTMNGKKVEEVVDAAVLQEANKLANESGE